MITDKQMVDTHIAVITRHIYAVAESNKIEITELDFTGGDMLSDIRQVLAENNRLLELMDQPFAKSISDYLADLLNFAWLDGRGTASA